MVVRRRSSLALCGLLLTGLCLGGCEKAGPDLETAPALAETVRQASPEEVVRSFVSLIGEHGRACLDGDKSRAAEHRAQIEWHIVARDSIVSHARHTERSPAISNAEIVHNCVSGWMSMLAFYLDDLDTDHMHHVVVGGDHIIRLTASGESVAATFEIRCVRGEDERWRISRVKYGPKPQPASAPATQPASDATPSATAP